MKYLVTRNPDTEDATSELVDHDKLARILRNQFPPYGNLQDGEAILIRRAEYLDTVLDNESRTGYGETRTKGHLTLIQGGNT